MNIYAQAWQASRVSKQAPSGSIVPFVLVDTFWPTTKVGIQLLNYTF